MALEHTRPDSFITGRLELSDGRAGMRAYLLFINSIYRKVIFGVHYNMRGDLSAGRRTSEEVGNINTSNVKGLALVENALYLLVNIAQSGPSAAPHSVSIIKTNMVTGSILQQVQIYSLNASIHCSAITATAATLRLIVG